MRLNFTINFNLKVKNFSRIFRNVRKVSFSILVVKHFYRVLNFNFLTEEKIAYFERVELFYLTNYNYMKLKYYC